ncbi:MAG: biotin--[acetyl-CoA-carboxylase] ligase [Rhizobiales bacterium]|nr:biotin--[acetyl-CoA-carboxylase] ligase [Hyphomicrobiales bacterium]
MAFALGPRAQTAGIRLAAFETIGSTNGEALERMRAGERGPLWLTTAHQSAGHGRRNRAWVSSPGNLAASIIQTIDASPAVAATLGFAAGLALDSALRQIAGTRAASLALKWPNDVLADGKKIAGILIETETVAGGLAVVVGIGVNVVAAPEGMPYPATSLAACGITASAEDVFAALSDAWLEFVARWDGGRGFSEIRRLWLARAAGLGKPMRVQSGSMTLQGIFETLDEEGRLVLVNADGKRMTVAAGDVHFGAAMSAGAA